MKMTWKVRLLAVAILAAAAQTASAESVASTVGKVKPDPVPVLLGTTGACNNEFPGGPCRQTSTLVQIDPRTGALVRTIGPVGYTVNGLAWDARTGKLYASTAIGDVTFHGLITIDPFTGEGTPVNPAATNFGVPGAASPVHSIAIDLLGRMVGWYDEFPPPPGTTDSFVQINKHTGIAKEFPNTGLDSNQNGVAFQTFGPISVLWNIDSPKFVNGSLVQHAYVLNPFDGKILASRPITPPTMAALGDFNPVNLLYYGLRFTAFDPTAPTSIIVIDPIKGTASVLGTTVQDLHVLAFVKR
jgi:hypothetical protein